MSAASGRWRNSAAGEGRVGVGGGANRPGVCAYQRQYTSAEDTASRCSTIGLGLLRNTPS